MAHMHFGRATPIAFRRFPSLVCHNLLGKTVHVPEDLEGKLNVLIVGFKTSHYKGMSSWMPFAHRLRKEVLVKHEVECPLDPLVQVYRLVIRLYLMDMVLPNCDGRQRGGILFRWWTDERLRLAIGDGTFENSQGNTKEATGEGQQSVLDAGYTMERTTIATPAGSDQSILDSIRPTENTPEAVRASKLQWIRSRTLVSFTDKRAFVESLQLADPQRVYIFLVTKQGDIAWCEHESYAPAKEMEVRELLQLPPPGTLSLPHTLDDVAMLPAYSERD